MGTIIEGGIIIIEGGSSIIKRRWESRQPKTQLTLGCCWLGGLLMRVVMVVAVVAIAVRGGMRMEGVCPTVPLTRNFLRI